MKRLLLATALIAAPMLAHAADAPKIDPARLSAHIKVLSSDAFEGRGPATEGEKKAVGYIVDQMKAIGQWNSAWDPFFELDPQWTDEFMATGAALYASGILPAKEVELLSIAFDASFTHMYAPGTRRHIHNALAAGATVEEIMEVLKLCVVQGVQACNLGVPILAEELARQAASGTR